MQEWEMPLKYIALGKKREKKKNQKSTGQIVSLFPPRETALGLSTSGID